MKCSLSLGKNTEKTTLTELYVNDSFTQDRDAWKKEFQTRGAEVSVDPEETTEEQAKWIAKYTKYGRQFSEDGRITGITVDLVLQAKARMSENMGNGPEDAKVSEMIQLLPRENINDITRCFLDNAPNSRRIVKLIFLRKPDAPPKKRMRNQEAVALTSMMSMWHVECFTLRLEKEEEPETCKQLHVRGVDGIHCQHLQLRTLLFQKHWE